MPVEAVGPTPRPLGGMHYIKMVVLQKLGKENESTKGVPSKRLGGICRTLPMQGPVPPGEDNPNTCYPIKDRGRAAVIGGFGSRSTPAEYK